jgi:hypothetical protein
MREAKERLVEEHRAEQLREQASAFAETQRLRSYLEAMEAPYGDRDETALWLAWAWRYLAQRDPLRTRRWSRAHFRAAFHIRCCRWLIRGRPRYAAG